MTRGGAFAPRIPLFGDNSRCLELPNSQYSGTVPEVTGTGGRELLLRVKRPDLFAGYDALASIKVSESDVTINPEPSATNSRLVGELAYQSELAGAGENVGGATGGAIATGSEGRGRVLIDLTRGTYLTVTGSSAVVMWVFLESSIEGVPINVYATKRVEAAVQWGTSINPVKAARTLQSFPVGPLVPSIFRHIPREAIDMLGLSTNPEFFSTLVADFATDPNPAGTAVKYSVVDPFRNGVPIRSGVEFVRFRDATNLHVLVTPTFELNL